MKKSFDRSNIMCILAISKREWSRSEFKTNIMYNTNITSRKKYWDGNKLVFWRESRNNYMSFSDMSQDLNNETLVNIFLNESTEFKFKMSCLGLLEERLNEGHFPEEKFIELLNS